MTREFLKIHRLALTPLAPIHIGLGVESEPIEYVIEPEKNLLYAFDPSKANLTKEVREELLKLAESGEPDSIHEIYKFIWEHKELFLPHAHSVIPVSSGVAQKYKDSLGRPMRTEGDLKDFDRNLIERAITLADGRPFIPGSGVKGAIRTAWLEALYRENPALAGRIPHPGDDPKDQNWERFEKNFEENMLKGDFQTSPFRLLKIADFMPAPDRKVGREILFACNYEKKNGHPTGLYARKEVIQPYQDRLFQADLTLAEPEKMGLGDLAHRCNEYYHPRLDKELGIIRNLVKPVWHESLKKLLAAMQKDFEDGRAFILRLGRYGDAETKTVADSEGRLPRIKISGLSSNAVFGPKTTTVWLAAEQDTDKRGLLPFGWVLVEIDPVQENKELLNFCKAESEEKARKEDDEAARAAKEKAWAALTPEDRLEDFRQRLEGMNPLESNEVGAAILSEGQKFLEDALTWPEAERQKCAEIIAPLFKAKNMFSVGGSRRTQRFKELLEKLRGKNNG